MLDGWTYFLIVLLLIPVVVFAEILYIIFILTYAKNAKFEDDEDEDKYFDQYDDGGY